MISKRLILKKERKAKEKRNHDIIAGINEIDTNMQQSSTEAKIIFKNSNKS